MNKVFVCQGLKHGGWQGRLQKQPQEETVTQSAPPGLQKMPLAVARVKTLKENCNNLKILEYQTALNLFPLGLLEYRVKPWSSASQSIFLSLSKQTIKTKQKT